MSGFVPSGRQAAIMALVEEGGFVATDDLVTRLGVTPQTIRRDLNQLCAEGLLQRFHGGAGLPRGTENVPYDDRRQTGAEEKDRIGEAAAGLVPDGASLFLNIGTTTEAVARALSGRKGLQVVTNNINVAETLRRFPGFQVMLAGGVVRAEDGGVVGHEATTFIDKYRLDLGVIGISGIDTDGTLLDFDHREVETARAIIRNARRVVLVADRHKFGRLAMNKVGHLRDVDVLVTDAPPPRAFAEVCDEAGVEVLVAS